MLLLCVSVFACVHAAMGQIREPDWGFQSYLDEDYTLVCSHDSLEPAPFNKVVWELPDGTKLTSGSAKYQLISPDNVSGMNLKVRDVQEADSGVYICHVYRDYHMLENEYRGRLLRGLNVGGPKYREAFDEYRNNLMVGGFAALALFIPLVTMCFVYKYRYQTDEQKRAKYAKRDEAFQHQRYLESSGKQGSEMTGNGAGAVNVAYENEENTKL